LEEHVIDVLKIKDMTDESETSTIYAYDAEAEEFTLL
jgi:hypothetical protein